MTLDDEEAMGVKGVTISNGNGRSTTTDADGYYSLVLPEGSATLTPSRPETTFTPLSANLTLIGDVQQNFTRRAIRYGLRAVRQFPDGRRIGGKSADAPLHTVTLSAYYIDKYEVTNARYAGLRGCGRLFTSPSQLIPLRILLIMEIRPMRTIRSSGVTELKQTPSANGQGNDCQPKRSGKKLPRGAQIPRIYPWGQRDCPIVRGHTITILELWLLPWRYAPW